MHATADGLLGGLGLSRPVEPVCAPPAKRLESWRPPTNEHRASGRRRVWLNCRRGPGIWDQSTSLIDELMISLYILERRTKRAATTTTTSTSTSTSTATRKRRPSNEKLSRRLARGAPANRRYVSTMALEGGANNNEHAARWGACPL